MAAGSDNVGVRPSFDERDPRHYLVHTAGKHGVPRLAAIRNNEVFGLLDIIRLQPDEPCVLSAGIQLNGKILPIFDLRVGDEAHSPEYDESTCIILLRSHRPSDPGPVGFLVNSIRA
jgi:hypothetical protein